MAEKGAGKNLQFGPSRNLHGPNFTHPFSPPPAWQAVFWHNFGLPIAGKRFYHGKAVALVSASLGASESDTSSACLAPRTIMSPSSNHTVFLR